MSNKYWTDKTDGVNEIVAKDFNDAFDGLGKDIESGTEGLTSHKVAEVLDHPDGSVTTEKIANRAVSSPKIADGAVTADKLGEDVNTEFTEMLNSIQNIIPTININYEYSSELNTLDLLKIYDAEGNELEITKENCLNSFSPKLFKVIMTANNKENTKSIGYLRQKVERTSESIGYLRLYQEYSINNTTEYVRSIRFATPDTETPKIIGWYDRYEDFERSYRRADVINDEITTGDSYPSTKAVVDYVDTKTNEIKQKSIPHTTVSDYPISVSDHLEGESVIDYKVYGNSVQDGTPSPDTPIEIHSVGNLVTDATSEYYGKYDIPITVAGKNLIPYPYTDKTKTINGVTFTDNGDGSITIDGTATANASFYLVADRSNYTLDKCGLKIGDSYTISKTLISGDSIANIYFTANYYNASGSMNAGALASTQNTATSKIQSDFKSWGIYLLVAKGKTVNNTTVKLQLEKGTSATEYEPYRGIEITHIYLDEPLRKVGDYADYIDYKNQKVVRCVDVLDDTGTKNISESYVALATPTEEAITAPDFDTSNSEVMNVSSGTVISPSSMDLTYYQDINKVITELKNAILAQGGNV